MAELNRTFHPKTSTYWGDGTGKDSYIVMANGGFNETRKYQGQQYNGWKTSTYGSAPYVAPHKEATAVDYVPDGSGRDTYIIRAYGMKRNYRSNYKNYERSLRDNEGTPMMDARALNNRNPFIKDHSQYNHW